MDEWISVKDRLPDPSQTVLVSIGDEIGIGGYAPDFGWWIVGIDSNDDAPVAHWMPLPAAPKP